MDIFLELQNGTLFSVKARSTDTIETIKERVEKCHGIPVSKQTLILNGQVLEDYFHFGNLLIFSDTRIQLHVSPDKKELVNSPDTASSSTTHVDYPSREREPQARRVVVAHLALDPKENPRGLLS
ncbi:ubiquitin C [Spatholobus suberectus]|nr:ubiquitin C [Spatholobus suberectus]